MSELSHDTATVDQTDDTGSSSQSNNVFIYTEEKQINEQNERQTIEHVLIDESVSVIHDKAFSHCTNLQTVEFSTTGRYSNGILKKLGDSSFFWMS